MSNHSKKNLLNAKSISITIVKNASKLKYEKKGKKKNRINDDIDTIFF